jgi:hypothetical protein
MISWGLVFSKGAVNPTPQRVIVWLTKVLLAEDLLVEFNDPQDAMLFKLSFA